MYGTVHYVLQKNPCTSEVQKNSFEILQTSALLSHVYDIVYIYKKWWQNPNANWKLGSVIDCRLFKWEKKMWSWRAKCHSGEYTDTDYWDGWCVHLNKIPRSKQRRILLDYQWRRTAVCYQRIVY